jgi:hypothetical protein
MTSVCSVLHGALILAYMSAVYCLTILGARYASASIHHRFGLWKMHNHIGLKGDLFHWSQVQLLVVCFASIDVWYCLQECSVLRCGHIFCNTCLNTYVTGCVSGTHTAASSVWFVRLLQSNAFNLMHSF